ncbi:LytTR family DNA-binding domain-containing protein [Colwellia sp. 1_MG-2023]|jgi:two-component system LytT family response regulator|uniref:LytR/AlgR family response regulator transcription factor n=1 Tax=unclassified Colwellia TaxID=196834 RepID=UPI001C0886B5|nr:MULTISPECIES: LytTR family DNA-binding domain-containing protein [unclassified Colwellia]MBU2924362.1 LytTR family DNA-binding domain-containing protein [Colwellia sp. C2M11]MDO6487224.1 LytTR family DNA-binding domain-containing protein [Colwellia sp. 6_MG-2023]MDO6650836.1 LytTR family DNA-binding domain-containing protein [Colwellia sp. 3_MG-2023]MDO6663871.1 LytTR family DNA-binding domain-containing protein [Colwellia sp. 2_MG-2023]MDO6688222.1 LytTR family DNA-binding domain-containin
MIFRTIIVDDEPLARKGLSIRLQSFNDIHIIKQCSNGREAIETIKECQVDLMFLDIQMPGLTGFQVIDEIEKQGLKMPMVVFATAFDQYAIKAFEVLALDYILKPTNEDRLAQTLDKIRQHFRSSTDAEHKSKLIRLVSDVTGNDYQQILTELTNNQPVSLSNYSDILAIKDVGEVTRVPVKDIIWIDAAGDYMCVHTTNTMQQQSQDIPQENTHILRKTMKQLEEHLDPKVFIRNHRSTIVNKDYVEKFCSQASGEYLLVLKNGKELKVSRSYKEKVKQAINS